MKISLIFLVTVMLLLSGLTSSFVVQPASAVTPTPSPFNSLFGPNIYKSMVHVNSADKGGISPYYHRYLANYSQNGYDSVLFNMDHDLLTVTDWEPYNGGFEMMVPWVTETTSSISGQYLVEQSSTQKRDGNYSLHDKVRVPGSTFGAAGVFQDMLWEVAPVSSNLNLAFSVYPVSLENVSAAPDSLIMVELDFNQYDSSTTVPRMFLVIQDNSSETLSNGTLFSNSVNDYYYVLNKQTALNFGSWNYFNINITDLAVKYYGSIKAYNLKVDGIHIDAYSRNDAVSEFYVDGVVITSRSSAADTYSRMATAIKSYDTSELRMMPGEKLDLASALMYFNIDAYFNPTGGGASGVRQTINDIHSQGDYVFLSKPDETDTQRNTALNNLWAVDGMAVFSTHNREPGGVVMDIWDYYLTKGVLAMAVAEQHPMSVKDVQVTTGTSLTQFLYAGNNEPATTVEALAQGRSFVEAGYIRPTMPLFFSAENHQIAAGKFPIYVDSSRSTASLDINLQNIPVMANSIRVVRNGTTVSTLSLQGLTSYSNTLTFSLPDKANYFRFEVLNGAGTVIAFSNPLVYVKKSITPDIWLALSPSLQYGSATSSIDSIKYEGNMLNFTATSPDTIQVTTKVFTPKAPIEVTGTQSWNYDNSTKILTVNSKGNAEISVEFNAVSQPAEGNLSVITTPINGEVFVDGILWGTAPVNKSIDTGSHVVSFSAEHWYKTPADVNVSITMGENTSVKGIYKIMNGTLTITTTPVNGSVFVNGTLWGQAPVNKSVDAGQYVVLFGEVSDYKSPDSINVTITAGANTAVIGNYTFIPQPPINGTLNVTTNPVNGSVFVDGVPWDTAPVNESIIAGTHIVSFGTMPGYTELSNITVLITAGQITSVTGNYTKILSPPPINGTLIVTTFPVRGEVFVDNISWGEAPVNQSISAGSHTVSFGEVLDYTKPGNITVPVIEGQNISVIGNYTLISSPPSNGTLIVITKPVNGLVFVDNEPWGTSPLNESVAPGSHTISFDEVSGYVTPANTTVSVTAGQNTSVTGTYLLSAPPSGSQYILRFRGFDYDNKEEITILVNNQVAAILPANDTAQNSGVFTNFSLNITKYVVTGSNSITFKESSDHSSGVENVEITGSNRTTTPVTIYSNSTYYGLWNSGTPQVTYMFNASVTLSPSIGTLSITTTPVNGEVLVDGTSWGVAPVSKSIAAGSHTVSFGSVSGYTAQSSMVISVTAGLTTLVTGIYTPVASAPVIISPPPPPTPPVSPPAGSALPARAATPPTVVPDKTVYIIDDELVVTGTASPSSTVTIKVLKPDSGVLGIDQGDTDARGGYNVTVLTWPSTNSTGIPFGVYTIEVTDAFNSATAQANVTFKSATATNPTTNANSTTVVQSGIMTSTITANRTLTVTVTAVTTSVSPRTITSTATTVSIITAASTQVSTVTTGVTSTPVITSTTTKVSTVQGDPAITTVTSGMPIGFSSEVTYTAIGVAVTAVIAAVLLAARRR